MAGVRVKDNEPIESAIRRFKKQCEKAGITVVDTGYQHNDMRDTGPDQAKASIRDMLDKFLVDDSPLRPVETKTPPPPMTIAGPVTPYAPVKN